MAKPHQQGNTKTLNFKFELRRPNPAAKNELHHATLNENTAKNFAKLNEKILELMPQISKRVYVLSWANSDGYKIIVDNNKSLKVALNEMNGPVYK